jgi:hypothetical protein
MTEIAAVIGAVAGLILALSALPALYQYRINYRAQRARWISDLSRRFYEGDGFKEIRRLVEPSEKSEFLAAIDEDPDLEQKWTDYLNFFELIAYLEDIGELNDRDVDAMFRYWLDALSKYHDYLQLYHYGNLVELLKKRIVSKKKS